MTDFKKLAQLALSKATTKKLLKESIQIGRAHV